MAQKNFDILPRVGQEDEWWIWIFLGLGPWALVFNSLRTFTDLPNPSTWDWIWTVIFLVAGVGNFVNIGGEVIGAIALVGFGVALLFRALVRKD